MKDEKNQKCSNKYAYYFGKLDWAGMIDLLIYSKKYGCWFVGDRIIVVFLLEFIIFIHQISIVKFYFHLFTDINNVFLITIICLKFKSLVSIFKLIKLSKY